MESCPDEAINLLLGSLNESERVRFLSTCKRLREWLHKRKAEANAAFNGLKSDLHEINGGTISNDTVIVSTSFSHSQGKNYSRYHVELESDSLISIIITEGTTCTNGGSQRDSVRTFFFSPWTRTIRRGRTKKNQKEERIADDLQNPVLQYDPELQMIFRTLIRHSKRLICCK